MELENQPIYKGVHKTLCINLWVCAAFFPKIIQCSKLTFSNGFPGTSTRKSSVVLERI